MMIFWPRLCSWTGEAATQAIRLNAKNLVLENIMMLNEPKSVLKKGIGSMDRVYIWDVCIVVVYWICVENVYWMCVLNVS